jgi:L-lysine 2,3-aminomutase
MKREAANQPVDLEAILTRYGVSEETRRIIQQENLLPEGLLNRLQAAYPQYSGIADTAPHLFTGQESYTGLKGFHRVVAILGANGIDIGHIPERELFIRIYRFLVTRHVLNSIDWSNFKEDSLFQLVIPQPGMIRAETEAAYLRATSEAEREEIVEAYHEQTNPHDGKQLLNKPWFESEAGDVEVLEGVQHKYPQTQLVFDKTTQHCFAFCTYCFRHAQVRGDEDMFLQEDIDQIHGYLRQHQEVTDLLITGGDAGFMPVKRLEQYVRPLLDDPTLRHVQTVRLGTRSLSYHPEMILQPRYDRVLALFDELHDNGIQLAWMAHFSTPRELLNPSTIAAIRRLQAHGAVIRSQSPIMNHVSLFTHEDGRVDVDRSAQNWIDLANIMNRLHISFHSIYCARPTGEHHYFSAPLVEVMEVFDKIYRSLASINRPSRHLSMTTSAGKISLMGLAEVNGETAIVMKFTEGRNMEWIDKVFLAKYDARENNVGSLTPFDTTDFFFAAELKQIEEELAKALRQRRSQGLELGI